MPGFLYAENGELVSFPSTASLRGDVDGGTRDTISSEINKRLSEDLSTHKIAFREQCMQDNEKGRQHI